MVRTQKATGRASSMPVGLLWGAGVSLGVTVAGAVMIARLVLSQTWEEGAAGYAIMVMLILGAFLGAVTASGKIKRQRLAVCAAAGAIYFLQLMSITALFFGGQYEAVGVTGLLILCGSMLAVLAGKQPQNPGKKRRRKITNR